MPVGNRFSLELLLADVWGRALTLAAGDGNLVAKDRRIGSDLRKSAAALSLG